MASFYARAVSVACSRCGAKVGEPCVVKHEHPRAVHLVRAELSGCFGEEDRARRLREQEKGAPK